MFKTKQWQHSHTLSSLCRAAELAIGLQLLLATQVVMIFAYVATVHDQPRSSFIRSCVGCLPLPAIDLLACLLETELACPFVIIATMLYAAYVLRRGSTGYFHLLASSSGLHSFGSVLLRCILGGSSRARPSDVPARDCSGISLRGNGSAPTYCWWRSPLRRNLQIGPVSGEMRR